MKTAPGKAGLLATVAALVVGLASPREAHAQFRVNLLGGAEHIGLVAPQGPSLVGTIRGEANFAMLPWIQIGGFGELLSDLGKAPTGSQLGAVLAIRPHIPMSSIDPMLFASVGYLTYPVSDTDTSTGWSSQVGVGLSFHVNPWVDVDARAALVEMLSRNNAVMDAQDYAFSAGLSLHP